jgi:tetratricopeptide (TPR) repeat protein
MKRAVSSPTGRSPRSRGLLLALALTTCAVVAGVGLFGGVLRDPEHASAETNAVLAKQLTRSGLEYQQRVRTTSDPALYTAAERVLEQAEALDPSNPETAAAQASLALSRHQFDVALRHARRAQGLAPSLAYNDALVGDALIELGRYREAFAAFDRVARARPGLAAYARVAYARELVGRPSSALEAHRLAVEAAGPRPTLKAAALAQVGELHISTGRLNAAERAFRAALRVSPGFGSALEGLAHAQGSRGRYRSAIRFAKQAGLSGTETLGDLYLLTRRPRLAQRQYASAHELARREARHGVRTDLEIAEFEADHGVRSRHALLLATRAHRARPSIEADSVLAWALTRSGRCREALRYADRSLRLGTQNAEAIFRRGMVERCLGRRMSAGRWFRRAVSVSPYFSLLWSPVARRYAAAYDS